MNVAAASIGRAVTPRRLYVSVAVLAAAIALVGFWPSYFGPLLARTVDKPVILHFHAAV